MTEQPDFYRRKAKYQPVSRILREVYGELVWQQTQSAIDELISCILSQNTSDINRDRGFAALKARYGRWQEVVDAPTPELVEVIRPAGLSNQKAPRIQKVLERIYAEHGAYDLEFLRGITLEEARQWLVSLDGVGPKTAAIVLCFSFNLPAFPVDTHIHRVGMRLGMLPSNVSADKAHPMMEELVPPEAHYAFHIYLIRHGRDTCKARKPACKRCPLTAYCDYYASLQKPDDN